MPNCERKRWTAPTLNKYSGPDSLGRWMLGVGEHTMMSLEDLLGELRQDMQRWAERMVSPPGLPTVLTKKRAMEELSIKPTKFKNMVSAGLIATCKVGDASMVPASEIYRLARPTGLSRRNSGGRPKLGTYDARAEAERGRARLKGLRKRRRKA